MISLDLKRCSEHIQSGVQPHWRGTVDIVSGVIVEATGVPAAMGELCRIDRGRKDPIDAEVVGFRGSSTLLMPHGDLEGIGPRQAVTALGHAFSVRVGSQLLGRVMDGFGNPIDDGAALPNIMERRRVKQDSPAPLSRTPIDTQMQTGVRAIDGLCTMGHGQRMGIFSGSGVGKSSLLGQITRGTDADVIIVALIGERGREVLDFKDQVLSSELAAKSLMVVATSDRPPIERFMAPFVAVTMAEHFRDQGLNVLVVMDSITRFAAAAREIGLAAGEPPTVRGYPPSFFATIPKLVERLGRASAGSITGLLTVLMDGDDPNEPVADTLRGLLDGHIYLSRDLANRGHFPAIDVLASLSRLMSGITDENHQARARELRQLLAQWNEGRDLVEIGAYKPGANPSLDLAIHNMPRMEAFLQQRMDDSSELAETIGILNVLLETGGAA